MNMIPREPTHQQLVDAIDACIAGKPLRPDYAVVILRRLHSHARKNRVHANCPTCACAEPRLTEERES